MEIRQNVRSIPTRPIVLAVATLFVLALELFSWYGFAGSARQPIHGQVVQTSVMGPDASERNQYFLQARGQRQSAAETTHGH